MNTSQPEELPHDHDHRLWDAALEAERLTGERETTVEAARAHLLIRVGRICGGTALLLLGIVLMVLPGPGLVLIIAGLTILAIDVPFARRFRDIAVARDKATSFIPKKLKMTLVIAGTVAGLGLSAFVLLR